MTTLTRASRRKALVRKRRLHMGLTVITITFMSVIGTILFQQPSMAYNGDNAVTTSTYQSTQQSVPVSDQVSRSYVRTVSENDVKVKFTEDIDPNSLTAKSAETVKAEADKAAADKAKAAADAAKEQADNAAASAAKKSSSGNGNTAASTDYDYNDTTDLSLTPDQVKASWNGVIAPTGFNPSHATGDIGNAYSFSQCTWWAYVRRHQLGLPAGSHMGDGAMWADTARSLGYWVDNNPHVGDVMVFQRGQEGASSTYGHVAIVEKVNADGSVTTSESGASLNGGTISRTFRNIHDFQYIHY